MNGKINKSRCVSSHGYVREVGAKYVLTRTKEKTGIWTEEALQTKKGAVSDHQWSSICRSQDSISEEKAVVGTKPTQQIKQITKAWYPCSRLPVKYCSTWAGKPRSLHKSIRWIQVLYHFANTVYFQMQQVFYQTKWKQCKKLNMI